MEKFLKNRLGIKIYFSANEILKQLGVSRYLDGGEHDHVVNILFSNLAV